MNYIFYIDRIRIFVSIVFLILSFNTTKATEKRIDSINNNGLISNIQTNQMQTSGTVSDSDGKPLPGVSVKVRGSKYQAMTNEKGFYRINYTSTNDLLQFSLIGYKTVELKIGNVGVVNAVLYSSQQDLEEVVVIGYGTQKKASVTGSVATVKGADAAKAPTTNIVSSLAGRMTGVTINTRGGNPGSEDISINIRGKSSWQGGSPLVIIDGIANRSGWERLNPNDIETISVLKDASAAIYGSRAANGVILVTTKRGANGRTSFDYRGDFGFTQVTRELDMTRSWQYAQYFTEAKRSGYIFTDDEIQKFKNNSDPNLYPNYDLNDYVLRKSAPQTSHSIAVNGGNEKTKYYVSGRFSNQDAVYKQGVDNFKSYNVLSNLDFNVEKNLDITVNISGRRDDKIRAVGSSETNGFFEELLGTDPTKPIFYKDGSPASIYDKNLVEQISGSGGQEDKGSSTFTSLFTAKWKLPFILQGLYLEGTGAYDFSNIRTKQLSKSYDLYSYSAADDTYANLNTNPVSNRTLSDYYYNSHKYTLNARLGYDKVFNKHSISSFVAYEQYSTNNEWISASRNSFLTDQIPYLFMGGAENQKNDGSGYEFAYRNVFGRMSYSYNSKYMLDFTLRRDESLRFSPDKRVGWFPGISAGWRISEEEFFKKHTQSFDNLKIRGSWGLMGSDNVADYQYLASAALRGSTSSAVLGLDPKVVPTIYLTGLPNPNITWEVANSANIGIDGSLWNGLLGFELEYFYTKRNNILATRNASIPLYSGITLPQENIGKATNQGIELLLTHRNRIGKFEYDLGVNFSYTKNQIIYMDESTFAPNYQRREGHPIDSWLLYKTNGIFNSQAEFDATPAKRADAKVGDIIYVDVDGDGKITDNDKVRLYESSLPKFIFGLPINLKYQDFELSMLWQGQAGAKTYINPTSRNGDINIPMWLYTDRWTESTAETATMPRAFYHRSESYNTLASDFWLQDASFIRLKSLQLAYNLPKKIMNRVGINNLKVYASGFNLLLFDKIKNYDPEVVNSLGVFYPSTRVYNAGLQLTF